MKVICLILLEILSLNVGNISTASLPFIDEAADPQELSFPTEPLNPSDFEASKFLVEGEDRESRSDLYENEVLYAKNFQQEQESLVTRNGLIDERKRWPRNGDFVQIPYIISSKFDQRQRQIIAKAFEDFHENTCIRFIPRINQKDYINIYQGVGCDSEAGRIGGEQTLSLGPGCDYTDTAIHELNHALGFWHEQNRPDRDNHVIVYLHNVKPENRFNFDKMNSRQVNTFGVAYDTDSIMHYDKYAFSVDPKKIIVMQPRIPNEKMGLAKTLSKSDILRIKKMYNCGSGSEKRHRNGFESVEDLDLMEYNEFSHDECRDFHSNCTLFSRVSGCEENPWVKATCRQSCNTCANPCQDLKPECPVWAGTGACQDHYDYMKLYCPESCQICQSSNKSL